MYLYMRKFLPKCADILYALISILSHPLPDMVYCTWISLPQPREGPFFFALNLWNVHQFERIPNGNKVRFHLFLSVLTNIGINSMSSTSVYCPVFFSSKLAHSEIRFQNSPLLSISKCNSLKGKGETIFPHSHLKP